MPLQYNSSEIKKVLYNGAIVKKVVYNGNTVWEEEPEWLPLESMTLDELKAAYPIGATKNLTLTTGETIVMQVLGYEHDDLANGNGKARMTWGMKDALPNNYSYGSVPDVLADIYEKLPSDCKQILKAVNGKGAQSYMDGVLFIPAAVEIFGEQPIRSYYTDEGADDEVSAWTADNVGEGSIYAGYSSDVVNIQKNVLGTENIAIYWTRSTDNSFSSAQLYVDGEILSGTFKSFGRNISFCFCI